MYISDAALDSKRVLYGHHKSDPYRIDFGLSRAGNLDAAARIASCPEVTAKEITQRDWTVWGRHRMQTLLDEIF